MPKVNAQELQLLKATISDDHGAMMELYDLYYPRLTRFLYRLVQDPEVIEELVNDVMLAVWQKSAQFRGDSNVSTWILGIAYRKGLDAARKMNRYRQILGQFTDITSTESASEVEKINADRDLNRLLGNLSTDQRAVAVLSFEFGYSYPEIAEILDIPVNTVKTRMYYARRTMQSSLAKEARRGEAP